MKRRKKLIVIANRLPVHKVTRSTGAAWARSPGGLVSALEPALAQHPTTWVGWDGTAGGRVRTFSHEGIRLCSIPVSRSEYDLYYNGFCNSTLWPLYHDAMRTPIFQRSWWLPYLEVNRRFAARAAREARKGDLVWVHDYHLQLAPRMIRELRPDVRIGFFLHIPFPPEELFAWLPWRAAILRGLLGADVVGFQTYAGAQNFTRLAKRYCNAEGEEHELHFEKRTLAAKSFPISIDFDAFDNLSRDPEVIERARDIRRQLGPKRKMLLAVDRLDYTKGIDSRLRAYEELLDERRISADRAVLVQIAVPTREEAKDYPELRTSVEQTVGRINGEHSEPGRVAVHYFRRSLSRKELAAYYLAADVMLVTPLRDGMNLVAKEYVATHSSLDGVLVLSEFAGAAREMRRALLVNPRDIDGMKNTIMAAITIDKQDARQRMAILRTVIRRHDVHDWSRIFMEALQG